MYMLSDVTPPPLGWKEPDWPTLVSGGAVPCVPVTCIVAPCPCRCPTGYRLDGDMCVPPSKTTSTAAGTILGIPWWAVVGIGVVGLFFVGREQR